MHVSIGMPFCNSEKTLADAIRSVFAQHFEDWELILVNDGSTDRSVEIAHSIRDPRVRVIDDGVNRGLVPRLNQIVAMAHGDYMARMDDDDVMHPDRIVRQIDHLASHPHVDVLGTAVYTIDLQSRVSGIRGMQKPEFNHETFLARCGLTHPTVTGKTAWFRAHPYDERFVRAEDHELWCRTFPETHFDVLCEPLMFYREGRSRTIRKYLLSGRSDRQIYAAYGAPVVGWRVTLGLMAKSLMKDAAYCALWSCRREEIALAYSRGRLDPQEQRAAQNVLDTVRRMHLPGERVGLPQTSLDFVQQARSE